MSEGEEANRPKSAAQVRQMRKMKEMLSKKQMEENKEKSPPPICIVTCGESHCATSRYIFSDYKCTPIAKGYHQPASPNTCVCFVDQDVFVIGKRKNFCKSRKAPCERYFVGGTSSNPAQPVELCQPNTEKSLRTDKKNDNFLLSMSKIDESNQEARLHLNFKIPRVRYKPCTSDAGTQYLASDAGKPSKKKGKGKKKKKGKGKGAKGKKKGKGKKGKGKKGKKGKK